MTEAPEQLWLMLIHEIPSEPSYFRVKVWRRLQRIGAVAIKSTVYVLPASESTREDFEWLLRGIEEGGGDATLCEVRFVDGLSDDDVVALFHAARDADYGELAEKARALLASAAGEDGGETDLRSQLVRLKRRIADVAAIDFFDAPGREILKRDLTTLEARLQFRGTTDMIVSGSAAWIEELRGRTWVTRKGIEEDRMASAWLILRFIDPDARFKFVSDQRYRPEAEELRFDMFEGEFTHKGDHCTFEVLIERLGLTDPALGQIAEIIHDIDLKDTKFGRPEAPGIKRLIEGIKAAHAADDARLARGATLFDGLYESFRGENN